MRKLAMIWVAVLLVSARADALYNVGDVVPNLCWTDANGWQVCLGHGMERVRVLLYNTGWCGYCKKELEELVPRLGELENDPVTFYSLSASGWSPTAPADQRFLSEWRDRYKIPFPVAASPDDPGLSFFEDPGVPNVAIVDREGRLAYKGIGVSVDRIFAEVGKLLP